MAGIQVPVEFLAQFGSALKGLDQFSNQVAKDVKSMETRFSSLTTIVSAIAGAFAVSKIIDGIKEVTLEAAHAEEVTTRLGNALKASGDFSEQNVQAFRDLADELARTSKFDDDLILDQVALAKQFNLTNREAEKLIRAAVDLSSATGDDLSTSVRNLGQTFDGTAGRIAQVVPQLQGLTAEQLRAGAAVDIVAARFAGFASGELQTFSGALTNIKKSFNDFLKSIGKTIVDNKVVVTLFQEISKIFSELADTIDRNRDAIRDFVSSGVIFLVDAFGVLVIAVDKVFRFFEILIAQIKALGTGFVGVWQIMTGKVKVGFDTIREAGANYSKEMVKIGERSKVFEAIAQRAADISVNLEKANDKQKILSKTTKEVKKGFDDQTNSVVRFNSELKQNFESLKKDLKDVGASQLEILKRNAQANFDLIERAKKAGFLKEVEREELIGKVRLKYIQDAIKVVQQNPFSDLFGSTTAGGAANLSTDQSTGLARGLAIGQSVLSGKEGARNLLGSAASEAGKALFGPAGEALGPIVKELSKGPEAVKKMVSEFADAIPELIINVIKALPVVIEVLADKLPEIIERLVEAAPDIIITLVKAAPRIITKLVLLVPKVIAALVKGAVTAGGELIKGAAGFIGRILTGAAQFVGRIIQGAGEFVKKILDKLNPFSGGGGFGLGGNKGLLGGGIIPGFLKTVAENSPVVTPSLAPASASGSHKIEVNVGIGKNQFAKAIVDVKRLGYRLEPI